MRDRSVTSGDRQWNRAWRLVLNDRRPVAHGGQHDVFERPDKPSQLVKVERLDRLELMQKPQTPKDWLKAVVPGTASKHLVREYRAYAEAVALGAKLGRPPPLAHLRGLIVTDRGLGQIVQKIRSGDGSIAPSLKDRCKIRRPDATVLEALNAFVRDIYEFNLVATDLRSRNIVYETRKGRSRFVMIDGYAVRTLIPLRRWSRWFNARKLDRLFIELGQRTHLHFDVTARKFLTRQA